MRAADIRRLREVFACALGASAFAVLTACDAGDPANPLQDGGATLDGNLGSDGGNVIQDSGTNIVRDTGPLPVSDAGTAGCGATGAATGVQSFDTNVGGMSRHYQVVVPESYDASRPTRLVFVFHGLGGNGNQIRAYLNLETIAAGNAIFVYPDGVVSAQTFGRTGWSNSDLALFDAMLAEISAEYCIDAERVFAMGHSFGAYMTDLVGCERGNIVRAVAQISGGTQGGTCQGPVPAWLSHGRSDTTVPVSQGEAARDHWRTVNGCANTTTPTEISDCVTYDGCTAPLTWCSFDGGHRPPFPAYTNQAIWDFFNAQ
jgi:poly(3-hydroxybutyrate) depolymerase